MKQLVLLRGIMGIGKSTLMKKLGLEQYVISPDNLRHMLSGINMNLDGDLVISQDNDGEVWKLLFEILEKRMEKGMFTIVDATHVKKKAINQYRKYADKYGYRIYTLSFPNDLDKAIKQNVERDEYKYVPVEQIKNASARMDLEGVPNWVTNIDLPSDYSHWFLDELMDYIFKDIPYYKPLDISEYNNVYHIGDIHGSYDVLKEFFDTYYGDNDLFIFVGDYVDRGDKNFETLKLLMEYKDKKNVVFLRGNHEKHLWDFANGNRIISKEFNYYTRKELEKNNIDKKEIRKFMRNFRDAFYYKVNNMNVLVTHGGLSNIPKHLNLISSEQLIRGVGRYSDDIDTIFSENMKDKGEVNIQIHGHRNIMELPIKNSLSFNLEGKIEFGGHLRIVKLENMKEFKCIEMKNNHISERMKTKLLNEKKEFKTVDELVESLRVNKGIKENKFNHISSFNFTRDVFKDGDFDAQTVKARGLFIDTKNGYIVARGYNKFFNIEERKTTSLNYIESHYSDNLEVYDKPNGFLGLLGYDKQEDKLMFCSKSVFIYEDNDGIIDGNQDRFKFPKLFMNMFKLYVGNSEIEKIKNYIKKNNVTLTFEVCDIKNDPHIIKYDNNKLVLLDIINNEIEFTKKPYEELKDFYNTYFDKSIVELKHFIGMIDNDKIIIKKLMKTNEKAEGVVIEDNSGNMVKIKFPYYNFWKAIRSVKENMEMKSPRFRTGGLQTPYANLVYNNLLSLFNSVDRETFKNISLIEFRDAFEFNYENGYDNEERFTEKYPINYYVKYK